MSKGLVSVIIPTFNRAAIIRETLDSLIAQTYERWECLIIDDGSTDDLELLVAKYTQRDNRFRFYKRPKEKQKGANACRNYGFEKSNGEFVNWFDSDDIMHPDFLKLRIKTLVKDATLDFCCCVYSTFTDHSDRANLGNKAIHPLIYQSHNYIEDYLLNGLSFITDSVVWKRKFLDDKTLFDEGMFRAQEWDFHFRMLTHNPKYIYLKDVLFYLRRGNESITKNAKKSIKAQKSIFKFFNNAFNFVAASDLNNKEKLKQYIFYRQAANYYALSLLITDWTSRLKVIFNYGLYVFKYSFTSKTNLILKLRLFLGVFILLFFKKGYRFFYYPQFDFRSYTKKA
ncbi:glycosyltransferase family 2 protein [Winogradskyella sp. PE311]|uniref:glycosyltransferase family 2 protein n=1 Tax=Winogradskyella sp. PE311 TaxID=3366943 RepID=UPI00397FA3FF